MSEQDPKDDLPQKSGPQRPSYYLRQTILDYLQDRNEFSPEEKLETLSHQVALSHGQSTLFSQRGINGDPSNNSEFGLEIDDAEEGEEEEQVEEEKNKIPQSYTKLIIENDNKFISEAPFFHEHSQVASIVLQLMNTREKYMFTLTEYKRINELIEFKAPSSEPIVNYLKDSFIPEKLEDVEVKNVNGVFIPHIKGEAICSITSTKQYLSDLNFLLTENFNKSTKVFCNKRLSLLSEKFNMHLLYNREKEFFEQKMNIHRDFYNIRKVDNLLDHAAAANVNLYLSFVKGKTLNEKDTEVYIHPQTQKTMTLGQVLELYDLSSRVITIEDLEVRSYFLESYPRFGINIKGQKPSRNSVLGDIFLKWDNMIKGRFLAELTHELFKEYKKYKFQVSELRISIFGKDKDEWNRLAKWFDTYKIYDQRVRWIIQIPHLYNIYRKEKVVKSFQEMLDNIFLPLFEVTINPESNPELHKLLLTVVGFDPTNEEIGFHTHSNPSIFKILPSQWTSEENLHFCYWIYYLWANVYALNHLRKLRGLNTFAFRPHISETSTIEHLMSAYLLAHGINRGARIRKSPLLQYLFYLKQIGISMSPLSENKLFLKYQDNPFPILFARGLNLSISTDHPLLYHMTSQPLIEEYSISSQVFDLNPCDLCELARNSVIQCGFEDVIKSYWIGENYKSMNGEGNDNEKTNVPQARYLYRIETLNNEFIELKGISNLSS